MPSQDIIDQFKGKVDFYIYKGQPCARKWPRWHPRESYPAEKANQDDFRAINQAWHYFPEFIKRQFNRMAQGTPYTGKDLCVRSYMSGQRLRRA